MNWTLFSWKSSLNNLNLKVDICFFGDSITRGGKFQNYFLDRKVCNLGITGDTLAGMMARTDMIEAVHPDKVFIMAGINDLLSGKTPENLIKQYRDLLFKIKNDVPNADIYVQSVLPINKKMSKTKADVNSIAVFNGLIQNLASEEQVEYIDLYALYVNGEEMPEYLTKDGVHLLEKAYDLWAEKIGDYIN